MEILIIGGTCNDKHDDCYLVAVNNNGVRWNRIRVHYFYDKNTELICHTQLAAVVLFLVYYFVFFFLWQGSYSPDFVIIDIQREAQYEAHCQQG